MRAVAIEKFGGPEQLKVVELPQPEAKPDEVIIKIAYTSVNPVDWKIREGYLSSLLPHHFPLVLGWDAAGTISEVGKNVRDRHVGEKVYAYCRKPEIQWGTYAEYVAMPAEHVAAMPEKLTFAEAAALPLVGLTAWQSLFDFANLKKGQSVLIHGGSGGVGSMAIQFAKNAGAYVFATAGTANQSYLRELGADRPIDYTKEDDGAVIAKHSPNGLDMVFDCVGGRALEESYPLVASGGCLVSIVEPPNGDLARSRNIKTGYVFVAPNGQQLKEIATLFNHGKLMALPLEEMPLERAAEAQEKNRGRHVRGKLVLKIS